MADYIAARSEDDDVDNKRTVLIFFIVEMSSYKLRVKS